MEYDGSTYFNLGEHITDRRGARQTEWVYTDIQNFDVTTDHIYTWNDATLIGNNTFGTLRRLNCADVANAQANAIGTNLQGGVVSLNNAIRTYNAQTNILLNNDNSIDYINSELEAGDAVVVGVHDGVAGGTDVLGTDHYITITGRTSVNGEG